MPFKFGDDRLRGFGLAESQSLPFPVDFKGRPDNTHTIVGGVITFISRKDISSLQLRACCVN